MSDNATALYVNIYIYICSIWNITYGTLCCGAFVVIIHLLHRKYTGFSLSVVNPSVSPSLCGHNHVRFVICTRLAGSMSYLHKFQPAKFVCISNFKLFWRSYLLQDLVHHAVASSGCQVSWEFFQRRNYNQCCSFLISIHMKAGEFHRAWKWIWPSAHPTPPHPTHTHPNRHISGMEGMKGIWIDVILGPLYDLDLWPRPWTNLVVSRSHFEIAVFQQQIVRLAWNWKLWIDAILDSLYDFDFVPAYDLDLRFSRSNNEMALCQEWSGHDLYKALAETDNETHGKAVNGDRW